MDARNVYESEQWASVGVMGECERANQKMKIEPTNVLMARDATRIRFMSQITTNMEIQRGKIHPVLLKQAIMESNSVSYNQHRIVH
jgi:hypothetical protein